MLLRFVTKRTMSLLIKILKLFITRDTSSTRNGQARLQPLTGVQIVNLPRVSVLRKPRQIFFGKVVSEIGCHDVECRIKSINSTESLHGLTNSNNNNPNSSGIDYTSYMKKRVDEMALENIHFHPKVIWSKISEELNKMSTTWRGLTYNQVT